MTIDIRNMTGDDLPDVKRVDQLCWNDLIERSHGFRTKLSQRTDENVLSYFDANPEGAFVASDGNAGLVGTCFSHIWGRTGWVGPLSILPSYQAQGIGKELLKCSITHLEDSGCTDIGLETMPENTTNLGMYLKNGFKPEGLILVLGKKLDLRELDEEPSGEVSIERYSESSIKEHLRTQVRRISNALRKGLDYSGELVLTERFGLGETLLATSEGKVVGFSVVHTLPRRLSSPQASIRVLGVDPDLKSDALQPLRNGRSSITVRPAQLREVPNMGRSQPPTLIIQGRFHRCSPNRLSTRSPVLEAT